MYTKLVKKLFARPFSKMVLGLENIKSLDKLLGYPSKQLRVIHVAGTNAKGSVVTKIAYSLDFSGYKV